MLTMVTNRRMTGGAYGNEEQRDFRVVVALLACPRSTLLALLRRAAWRRSPGTPQGEPSTAPTRVAGGGTWTTGGIGVLHSISLQDQKRNRAGARINYSSFEPGPSQVLRLMGFAYSNEIPYSRIFR